MVSIGTSPRNSMRLATSDALGAVIDPLTRSPLCVRARYRKLGTSAPHRRDAEYFRGRCYSGSAFGNRVLDHGHHAGLDRGAMNDLRVGVFRNQVPHAAGHLDEFEDPVTAAIASAAAPIAAMRFVNCVARIEAERGKARILADVIGI